MHLLIALALFALVCVGLFLARARIGLFWSALVFYLATVAFVRFGFDPPAPGSVVKLYAGTAALAMLLYVSSSASTLEAAWSPLRETMVRRRRLPLLVLVLVLVPSLVAWVSWKASLPVEEPPPRIRSVHPSPPGSMELDGATIDLASVENPYRALEISDPEGFAERVARGRVVYYENCFYCHGDTLAADGHLASSVQPPPADFTDPGNIAMLQEGYLFWRIAEGGPGLPGEGTPWDSTMPAWRDFLDADDMWSVVLFLYADTGYRPRANEEVH